MPGNDGFEFTYIGSGGDEAGVLGGCANRDGQGVSSGHEAGGVGGIASNRPYWLFEWVETATGLTFVCIGLE